MVSTHYSSKAFFEVDPTNEIGSSHRSNQPEAKTSHLTRNAQLIPFWEISEQIIILFAFISLQDRYYNSAQIRFNQTSKEPLSHGG